MPFSSEYWLGLNKLHEMTQSGKWNVVFEVVWDKKGYVRSSLRSDPLAGTSGKLEMADFKVASEADNYRLTIGGMVRKENWGMNWSESDFKNHYTDKMNGKNFGTRIRNNGGYYGGCWGGCWGGNWNHLCLNSERNIVYEGFWRWPATTSIWLKKVE